MLFIRIVAYSTFETFASLGVRTGSDGICLSAFIFSAQKLSKSLGRGAVGLSFVGATAAPATMGREGDLVV
jgi:hypothetical protein